MPTKAMILASDSQNQTTPTPRPGRRIFWLTAAALEALEAERTKPLPMDALPQIEIKAASPVGNDYGGF